ncbi:MAG TPA: hypothetical protein VGP00_06350 [Nocardioides sp.]|jgi:pantoate kinase|nr:hypothetical protein [Nocardioides sp.]
MNDTHALIETEARQRINERVSRAAAPRLPRDPSRHRLAQRLRSFADRIEN